MRLRKLKFSLFCITVVFALNSTNVFASTQNFYFEDFTADYYLSRDEQGLSHMKVIEQLTAVFPNYDQNKGICRQIPFTNRAETNVTLPNLTDSNLILKRNGLSEPIYSIEKYSGHYEVCTGDDNYVRGRQVYTLEYEFKNVITDYSLYQELYWDTNGNGWMQRFDNLTARVHFADDEVKDAFEGESWCYVGTYGVSGSERCEITEISDGVQFETNHLSRHENLTFDIQFKPDSFLVPPPEKSYAWIILASVIAAICAVFLSFTIRNYLKVSDKRKFYKGYFIKPEYQPSKSYSITELSEIYIGKKKNVKVALLLDMIVKKKISIIKGEKKLFNGYEWWLIVNKIDALSNEEKTIIKLLNGGNMPEEGEKIEIKKHKSTYELSRLAAGYDTEVLKRIKADGLVNSNYKMGGSQIQSKIVNKALYGLIMTFCAGMMLFATFASFLEPLLFGYGAIPVGREYCLPIIIVLVTITVITGTILMVVGDRYKSYTKKGLEASRYMDGLKMYIGMAESERMKLLQSVKGADTSSEGIVKLYEKLLPYAAVFGLEDSWMEELKKYYELGNVDANYDVIDAVTVSNLMSDCITRAANYTSFSGGYSGGSLGGGGGFSSGSSGGGGGGFSGGGGGGGGGGGR